MTMARKQSGGIGKFLNFIGLVDDGGRQDSYDERYDTDSYGRQAPYTPQRASNGRANGSRTVTPGAQQRRSLPAQSSARAYDSRRSSYGDDERRTVRRGPAIEDDFDQERYGTSARTSAQQRRPRSRFEEDAPAARPEPQPQLVRTARIAQRQRTVMLSIHKLSDCCDVIDNLIGGNTIVLTMEDLDVVLMQRAVDTLSGAVFALQANIRKASDKTYLIAPANVEIDGNYDVDSRF